MNYRIICCFLFVNFLPAPGFPQPHQTKVFPPMMLYYLNTKEKSRIAVFRFDKNRDVGIRFDENSKPTSLTNAELKAIQRIINDRVAVYNKHYIEYPIKQPEKYFKQVIPVVSSNGEKEVWISCHCTVMRDTWRNFIGIVDDGGTCEFSIKINLTKGRVIKFWVNGLA
jgi:hypothetical protein